MTKTKPPVSGRRWTPARSLPQVVGRFIQTESAGGIALVAAGAIALLWANSPWQHGYFAFWHTPLRIEAGPLRFTEDLQHFVNDALMAIFFFVVGLEIKREAVIGELSDRRVAALPAFAALGGMLVPAALYAVVANGSDTVNGWGIPMATDIAFALGVLGLLSKRVPAALTLFLLTLAIVDDVGAIIVIAVFYSGAIAVPALLTACSGVLASFLLRRARVDWPPIYLAIAIITWFATYESGVHATIAGVALALTTPVHPLAPAETVRRWARDLSDEPSAAQVHQMTIIARESVSPAEHLQELLHPTTSFMILPLFALANAGVTIRSDMLDGSSAQRVAAGVVVGLLVGKTIGIVAGAALGVRLGLASLPPALTWRHITGAAALGGIGFTVSLFIANLAFDATQLVDAARLGILVASVFAAIAGVAILTNPLNRRSSNPSTK